MQVPDVLINVEQKFGISPEKRIFFWGGIAGIVLLSVTFLSWAFNEEYQTLYRGLNQEDAAEIIKSLESKKVDYKIVGEGEEIQVRGKDAAKTRLDLAGDGVLLNSGVGFEVFDNTDYGMTDFTQKINLQRALQGELSRTITTLDEVKFARIHLVIPEASLFSEKNKKPKASVTLIVEPNKVLTEAKVSGIQRLVASAVEDLQTQHVVVLNSDGVILSNDEKQQGNVQYQLRAKQQVENYLRGKAYAILDGMDIGYTPLIDIDVSVNYDEIKRTTEQFDQAEKGDQIVQRSKTSRTVKEGDKSSDKNTPSDIVTEVQEHSYVIGREVEERHIKPGAIKRITVGLLVPESAKSEDMASIEHVIANVVGLDRSRGDKISVSKILSWSNSSEANAIHSPENDTATNNQLNVSVSSHADQNGNNTAHIALPVTESATVSEAERTHFVSEISQNPLGYLLAVSVNYWQILLGVSGFVILLLTWFLWRSKQLRQSEREELLMQMKLWLEVDPVSQNARLDAQVKP